VTRFDLPKVLGAAAIATVAEALAAPAGTP